MSQEKIDHLIINSPYAEPQWHWEQDPNTLLFDKKEGRRRAGFVKADPQTQAKNQMGVFVPIPLVEEIRPRIKKWRSGSLRHHRACRGYPAMSLTCIINLV